MAWRNYDASALMEKRRTPFPGGILIDQGLSDKFLQSQLYPHVFQRACMLAAQPVQLRRHAGYDHGYYFVSSFIDDHLRFHLRQMEDRPTASTVTVAAEPELLAQE